LPRGEAYQRVLCDHLDSLKERDFEVRLVPLQFQESHVRDPDDLFRLWLLLRDGFRSLPSQDGLRLPAGTFLLSSVEREGGVYLDTKQVAPEALAWWSTWDHPANPYRDSPGVRARALVGAAVGLLMLDLEQSTGQNNRSDLAGGPLIEAALTYWHLKPHLSTTLQGAFETGLVRVMERIEKWGPTGIHADMDLHALVALWYLADAVGTPEVRARAEAYARRVLDRHLRPAGYVDHGGGYDPSYNGISLHYLTWLALVSTWGFVREGLESMLRLKAHMALPEPGGNPQFGPTHFATNMSEDAASDQWAGAYRDVATAMLSDEALYLLGPGRLDRPSRWSIPEPLEMRRQIAHSLQSEVNRPQRTAPAASDRPFQRRGWVVGPNFAFNHYRLGFYDRVAGLRAADSPLLLPPVSRPGTWIRRFGEDFVVARFDHHAAIVHTGSLSWWDGLSGLSGGALSALWTPDAGPLLLGRVASRPLDDAQRDSWAHLDRWQTHAISGRTSAGKGFSSARIRDPQVEIDLDDRPPRVTVRVQGSLGASIDKGRGCEEGAIEGAVRHEASMVLDSEGVVLEGSLRFESPEPIASVWASIPVFDGHPRQRDPERLAQVEALEGDVWRPVLEDWGPRVVRVRVLRRSGGVSIVLSEPHRVRLSAPPGPFGRALLVELETPRREGSADHPGTKFSGRIHRIARSRAQAPGSRSGQR